MFRWLNLTDIHVGMEDQNWLWPNLKHELFDDLTRLVNKNGNFDAIIFSGDLVQKGTAAEFDLFTKVISEIIEHLTDLGQRPTLITAPGNHDLIRPRAGGMFETSMRQVPEDRLVLKNVLDPDGEFIENVRSLFAPFTQWQKKMIDSGLHCKPDSIGIMPGDASYTLGNGERAVGVVTLNSAWLQMRDGEYKGMLHVDPRQLLAVTDNDPVQWCRSRWSRLIVTHHPTTWLSPTSIDDWNSEIFPPDRFDIHLFGHMHDHDAAAISRGGGGTRRSIQGHSIFGLEHIRGKIDRSHGYSVSEIDQLGDERFVKVWPRVLGDQKGGGRRLYPDFTHGLNEDNYYQWPLTHKALNISGLTRTDNRQEADLNTNKNSDIIAPIVTFDADKLRFYLPQSKPHLAIRAVERAVMRAAFSDKSAIWIGFDWGAGEDGFLWSVLHESEQLDAPIFRVDIERYVSRSDFLNDFFFANGFRFEQLCDYISQLPDSILLLDGFQTSAPTQLAVKPVEIEIEELCAIIREFAPSAQVVVRGRVKSGHISLPYVTLNPLEEADVADYVRAHENGGSTTPAADIATMWRFSGGSVVRLEALLRDLGVTSLRDLVANEPDYGSGNLDTEIPPALAATVRDLQDSELDILSRSYSMLEALSSLPRGEQFERMRRFNGAHGFWPKHVHELTERGLVESVPLSGMARLADETPSRALIVPRIVRDFVRESMNVERRREIDTRALELYFGTNWKSGDIKNSMAGRRCRNPLCEPYEINNASVLILRLMSIAFDNEDLGALEDGVRLTSAFIEVIRDGDHYASAVELATQVLPLVENPELSKQADVLRYSLARSLRMIGDHEQSRTLFENIASENLSKDQKRQVDLNLALIHQGLGSKERAATHARSVLKGGRKDGPGIQAQSIIAQIGDDRIAVILELKRLEDQARKIGSDIAANNIALALSRMETGDRSNEHINRVIENTDLNRDFYNGAKAIVQAMKNITDIGIDPSDVQIIKLINAYQHLYNERAGGLFDKSHDALWAIFVSKSDPANLLRLFRHSSFIWRLRNQDSLENIYRGQLAKLDAQGAFSKLRGLDREIAYFKARAAAALVQMDDGKKVLLMP